MAGKEGKKSLEKKMDAKKADQTKNVKKLTTSNDAYSPEKRIIHGKKPSRTGGSTNFVKVTTDQVNLNAEKNKLKKENPGFNVKVFTPKEYGEFRGVRPERKKTLGSKLKPIKLQNTRPPQDELARQTKRPKKFAGGGMATRGLGRAFMKGGKV